MVPSHLPSIGPSIVPSVLLSVVPSVFPSNDPTPARPTICPTHIPSSSIPSFIPSSASPTSAANFAVLSSSDYLTNFNTQSKLLLVASVRTSQGCISNWTVDDPNLSLSEVSLTAIQQPIFPQRTTTVQLYLAPNSLSTKHQYVFQFNCRWQSTAIKVMTNSPPSNGFLEVLPREGHEISTVFNYSTGLWEDDNLPLEYQFSYVDISSGSLLVVRDKEASPNATSFLPSGLSANLYSVNCSMTVFDVLTASSYLFLSVIVRPSDQSSLNNFISSQLSITSSAGTINLIGTILNKVNCSGTTHCSDLNRFDCSTKDFTCGECKVGFIGQAGPSNTQCISHSLSLKAQSSNISTCSKDSDCSFFQSCNISSRHCYTPSKQCPNSCSSQGHCIFVNTNNGISIETCEVFSSDCSAICICNTGFAGSSCAISSAQLAVKQQQRAQLLQSFNNLLLTNVSSQTLISRAATLLSITQNSDEIGSNMIESALSSVNDILQRAGSLRVDYTQLISVLQSTDSVAAAAQNANHSSQLVATLQSYSSIVSGQILPGQTIENILSTFRSATANLDKSASNISVPITALEQLQSVVKSYVHFQYNSSSLSEAKVSIIETNSKLFSSEKPLLANPLTIQISTLSSLNNHNATSNGHNIVVFIRNIEPVIVSPVVNFTTVCRNGNVFNFTCPQSGHRIVHNCSEIVGILISYCPVYRPSCQTLPMKSTASVSQCRMLNFTRDATTCLCAIFPTNQNSRRLSTSGQSPSEESGAVQLITLTELVASDFLDTFSAAPSLTSAESIDSSVIVIGMFSTLWGFVVALTCFCTWTRRKNKSKNSGKSRIKPLGEENPPAFRKAAKDYVLDYIMRIFPSDFQQKSNFRQLMQDLSSRHRYLTLFLTFDVQQVDENTRILNAARVLTYNTMLMFLQALFYDLHSPADDGSCSGLNTMNACLVRRSALDPSRTYCTWSDKSCTYRTPDLTLQTILIIGVIVSIVTAILLRPIEYFFLLLKSPIADSKKVVANFRSKRVANVSAEEQLEVESVSKIILGLETRVIPQATVSAQRLATISLANLYGTNNRLVERNRHQSILHNPIRKISTIITASLTSRSVQDHEIAGDPSEELFEKIVRKRRELSGHELIEFDQQWCIDETGNFPVGKSLHFSLSAHYSRVQAVIAREILKVRRLSVLKIDKLKLATDEHVGLELLHLFVLDLLGRDTPAAQIFEQRSEEDFKRMSVVSVSAKCVAAVLLLLMNFFFAYYSVLYGFLHGLGWQRNYLIVCTVQLIVEVFINETLEVLWVHVLAPKLVREEVQTAVKAVVDLVNKMFTQELNSSLVDKDKGKNDRNNELNVPDYLFVSTNVAKSYPKLIEATIVSAFCTHLPGELSKKWRSGTSAAAVFSFLSGRRANRGAEVLRLSSVVTIAFSLLQYAASTPLLLQRMVVRSGQPLFVSALFIAYSLMVKSSLYIGLVCAVPFCVICFVAYKHRKDSSNNSESRSVMPVLAAAKEERVNSVVNSEDKSIDVKEISVSEDSDDDSLDTFSVVISDGNVSDFSIGVSPNEIESTSDLD